MRFHLNPHPCCRNLHVSAHLSFVTLERPHTKQFNKYERICFFLIDQNWSKLASELLEVIKPKIVGYRIGLKNMHVRCAR